MSRVISGDNAGEFKKWESGDVFNSTSSSKSAVQTEKQTYQKSEVDAMLEQARKEAYDTGVLQGLQQAKTELKVQMQDEISDQKADLSKLVKSLQEPVSAMDETLEKDILGLVMSVASVLYRREVSIHPEQMLTVIKEAKSLLPSSHSNVRIHLNPEDVSFLQDSEFDLNDDSLCQLFVEDENLKRGDCRVISDQTQVDATLEARLNTIIEQVLANEQ